MREQLLILGHTLLVPMVSYREPTEVTWTSSATEFPNTPPIRVSATLEHFESNNKQAHSFRIESATFNYDPDGNESMSADIIARDGNSLNEDSFAIDIHRRFAYIFVGAERLAAYGDHLNDPTIRDFYMPEAKSAGSDEPGPNRDSEPAYTVVDKRVVIPDNLLTMSTNEPPLYL